MPGQYPRETPRDGRVTGVSGLLINFNRDYVSASSNGKLEYVSQGIGSGNCSVTCHGKDHEEMPYALNGVPPPPRSQIRRR